MNNISPTTTLGQERLDQKWHHPEAQALPAGASMTARLFWGITITLMLLSVAAGSIAATTYFSAQGVSDQVVDVERRHEKTTRGGEILLEEMQERMYAHP